MFYFNDLFENLTLKDLAVENEVFLDPKQI